MNGREKIRLCINFFLKADIHKRILKWFQDKPGVRHPYSVHNIAHLGTMYNVQVGDW